MCAQRNLLDWKSEAYVRRGCPETSRAAAVSAGPASLILAK